MTDTKTQTTPPTTTAEPKQTTGLSDFERGWVAALNKVLSQYHCRRTMSEEEKDRDKDVQKIFEILGLDKPNKRKGPYQKIMSILLHQYWVGASEERNSIYYNIVIDDFTGLTSNPMQEKNDTEN